MKKIYAAACVVACCMGNPAMALTPPVCFDCSFEESMRLNDQYRNMQRMEQQQRQLENQLQRLEQRNQFSTY